MGATNEVALVIFSGLLNGTESNSSSPSDAMADLGASINILDSMASATATVSLDESVFDVRLQLHKLGQSIRHLQNIV